MSHTKKDNSPGSDIDSEVRVAFLIHPRGLNYRDDYRTLARLISSYTPFSVSELKGINNLPKIIPQWAMNLGNKAFNVINIMPNGFVIEKGDARVRVFLVATMTSPEKVFELGLKSGRVYAKNGVIEAARYAQNVLKCQVIGLGAYTAPWAKYGAALRQAGINCPVITHGDHQSAVMGVMAMVKMRKDLDFDYSSSSVAIVGASGLVGGGMARIIASMKRQKPRSITLIAHRRRQEVENLREEMLSYGYTGEIKVRHTTEDKQAVDYAHGHDIVILSTTAQGELLGTREAVKQGRSKSLAVEVLSEARLVVDMAMPFGLPQEAYDECVQEGLNFVRIDGGVAKLPHVDFFDMYSMPGDVYPQHRVGKSAAKAFACLTETIILGLILSENVVEGLPLSDSALVQNNEVFISRSIDPHIALRLYERAKKYHFRLTDPMCFGELIDPNDDDEDGSLTKVNEVMVSKKGQIAVLREALA